MTTVQQLRAKAKAYGMHGYSKLGKWDLERAIMEHELMLQRTAEIQEQRAKQKAARKQQAQPENAPVQEVNIEQDDTDASNEAYRQARSFIKNNDSWTSAQVWKIINLNQEIKSRNLRDGHSLMTIGVFLWRQLAVRIDKEEISVNDAYHALADWLAFFNVECREDWDLEALVELIESVDYWINEYQYNKMYRNTQTASTETSSQPEAPASAPAPETAPAVEIAHVEVKPVTTDTSSLKKLAAQTHKDLQRSHSPYLAPASVALWLNEIQKYHPEMKCWDAHPIATAAARGNFSSLPEDMLLIVQELSEPDHQPETIKAKPVTQTIQTSEPQAPVQEVKPERKLPTPKSRNHIYDFSECKDAKTLRKALNSASIENLKMIAESYREFQPRSDGKPMTKKFYVDAIVRLYFPEAPEFPLSAAKKQDVDTRIISDAEAYAILANMSSLKDTQLPPAQSEETSIPAPDYDAAFDETAYTPERQDNLAVLDDIPENHEPEHQTEPREPWQEHICDHCNNTPNWTHEQFVKGILLSYEHMEYYHKPYQSYNLTGFIRDKYTLVQLWNLAKFFGLNVPAIELTSENKTMQKKHQIASIIANEICSMEHVYVCTYESAGAPALPAELAECAPKWEKEMIARAQSIPAPIQESTLEHQPEPVEPERQQETTPKLENFYGARCLHDIQAEWFNMGMVKKCDTPEKLDALLRTSNKSTLWFIGSRLGAISKDNHSTAYFDSHNEEFFIRLCVVHIFPEYEYNAEPEVIHQQASKTATRKPHKAKKIDETGQILIQFDEEDTPAPAFAPAKPKTCRARKPRIKRDYSNQILIDFGENVADSQINQRKAA